MIASGIVLASAIVATALKVRHELAPLEGPERLELAMGMIGVATGRSYAYVLDGPSGLVLIDTGSDVAGRALRLELERRGKTFDDVQAILLTSSHPDVLAGAHLFPRATIYAGAEDEQLVQGERFPSAPLPRVVGRWFVRQKRTQPIVPALGGARLSVAGLSVEVVALPGVTSGGRAWVIEDVAFLGEAVSVRDGEEPTLPVRLTAERPRDLERALPRLAQTPFSRFAAARGVGKREQLSELLIEPR